MGRGAEIRLAEEFATMLCARREAPLRNVLGAYEAKSFLARFPYAAKRNSLCCLNVLKAQNASISPTLPPGRSAPGARADRDQ